MQTSKTVTCSFQMDRETYNAFKSIITRNGENVKGNLVRYMQRVIAQDMPNAATLQAMREVEALKNDPHKKSYSSFAEMVAEITDDYV